MDIGWIGTGVMGRSMAGHLMASGHRVFAHSRTRSKAEELIARGAAWCETPAEVGGKCETVFMMVGFPHDVEKVIRGSDGLLQTMRRGGLIIDCTTSSPKLARELSEEAANRGIDLLDAPVSGGDTGARNATLSIMVGGSAAGFERALPLLKTLGKTVVHQGPAGSGQHTKMVNQILIAPGMMAVCEALVYTRACGLDMEKVLESVSGGAAGSWSLSNYAPRILKSDFAPGFYVEHFLKDMKIALDAADEMKLCLPGLALAKQLYTALVAMGGGKNGTQALIKVYEAMSMGPRS